MSSKPVTQPAKASSGDGSTPAPMDESQKPTPSTAKSQQKHPGDGDSATAGGKLDPATTPTSKADAPTNGAKVGGPGEKPKQPTGYTPPTHPVLRSRPFVIKTNLVKPGTAEAPATTVKVTGSILSQTLDKPGVIKPPVQAGADVSGIPLQQMRVVVPSMSRFSTIHQFCTPSGDPISDETITLAEYLALTETVPTTDTAVTIETRGLGTVNIYFKSPLVHRLASAGAAGKEPELKGIATSDKTSEPLATAAVPTARKEEMNAQLAAMRAELAVRSDSTATTVSAGTLSEAQWGTVLRNCAVFYGWIVDPSSQAICRAPKPAFRLRAKPVVFETEAVTGSGSAASEASNGSTPSTQATKAEAHQQKDDPAAEADTDLELPSERAERLKRAEADTEAARSTLQPPKPAIPLALGISSTAVATGQDQVIPNYRINDDSRIEVTVCRHELAMSMARNDFSSQSTEASVSGGAFGVQVGASAGYAKSESSSNKETVTQSVLTMVGRYMYPRCDLFLYPDDLEPTPELASLIEAIRVTKNIRYLRKLQADYGQFFCQRLTLGARLMSTRIMTDKSKTSVEEQKHAFKVSVGASVSTSFAGASVKNEQEKGGGTASSKSASESTESNVFEAVGGDTILANNPGLWTASVAAPESWRIINREGLSSLAGMISEMPGYGAVQSWFVQAVPALGKYFNLGETHTVTCRLKIQTPTNDLHKRGPGNQHYLSFHPNDTVSPCLFGVDTTIINNHFANFWVRIDMKSEKRLFWPQSYRAPVIRGFDDFAIGGQRFGVEYNDDFASTNWDIIAPFNDNLSHGCRIILRSKPRDDKAPVAHMAVMRTAQGAFIPVMSNRDEYQYWRLLKTEGGRDGEPIEVGDRVRLCWSFHDQTTGFRDFVDDSFGRRQTKLPSELAQKPLYLKVPWPRFEEKGKPVAVILGPGGGEDMGLIDLHTLQGDFKMVMQDVSFRIDTVDNDGTGDSNDYVLKGVSQEGDKQTVQGVSLSSGNPLQMHANIWRFGVGF